MMSLLTAFQRKKLKKDLKKKISDVEATRIQIMLMADEGCSQKKICESLQCTNATASRWIQMAKFGQAHHWQQYGRGRPRKITPEYHDRLQQLLKLKPGDVGLRGEEWKARTLQRQLERETGIQISDRHINRLIREIRQAQLVNSQSQSTHPLNESHSTNPQKISILDIKPDQSVPS